MVKAETNFPDKLHQAIRLYCTHTYVDTVWWRSTVYEMFQQMVCTPQQVCNLVNQGKVQENWKLYGPFVNLAATQGLWQWNVFQQGVAGYGDVQIGYKITYVFTVSVICEGLLTNCDVHSYMWKLLSAHVNKLLPYNNFTSTGISQTTPTSHCNSSVFPKQPHSIIEHEKEVKLSLSRHARSVQVYGQWKYGSISS
jgi:hypothetical protein